MDMVLTSDVLGASFDLESNIFVCGLRNVSMTSCLSKVLPHSEFVLFTRGIALLFEHY